MSISLPHFYLACGAARLCIAVLAALCCTALLHTAPAAAQAPLFLADKNTTVDDIAFTFIGSQTFDEERLKTQIATREPSTWDAIKRVLPFLEAGLYPFDPIVLQKDVIRLRRFYERNGFLRARVDYYNESGEFVPEDRPLTTLDTTDNEIDIIFAIDEGPPLIIQDVSFLGPDSARYAVTQFQDRLREEWIDFRDRVAFETGQRYTQFNRIQIEDQVLSWLQNRGFAFAQIGAATDVDSTANTVDIRFFVDAGPRARVSEIEVEGNESVEAKVVRRELPFKVGDRFSQKELVQGQRSVFGLNLFRLALADVPSQERDSTVRVRLRVREARPRYISAETGYARNLGLTGRGQWSHRNFLGGARSFSVDLVGNTGFWAAPGDEFSQSRLFRASVSLRQPYLFKRNLSGIISPFLQFEQNPLLPKSEKPLDLNAREFGLNTTLIYEVLPFRTISLQHSFSRALIFGQSGGGPANTPDVPVGEELRDLRDFFDKSIFSLNGTFGRVDDFLDPSRGFLVRPLAETGGEFFGSEVEYFKLSNELTGYLPLSERISLAGRLFTGRLWPTGRSDAALSGQLTDSLAAIFENRFDPIFFYNGGSNDVRGWRERLAGEKTARRILLNRDTDTPDTLFIYEPEGGPAKLSLNAELRLPFPGLGESWGTAAFLDAGQSDDSFDLGRLRYGTGAGIRYRTPVGYLRLDLGYKINPDFEDLRDPEDVFEYEQCLRTGPDPASCDRPEADPWRRFRLHLSIGQTF